MTNLDRGRQNVEAAGSTRTVPDGRDFGPFPLIGGPDGKAMFGSVRSLARSDRRTTRWRGFPPPRARSRGLIKIRNGPVSVGESWSDGIGRPAPDCAEVGPLCRQRPCRSEPPRRLGPLDRTHPRPEVGRYFRCRVWHRGIRFGLSDCVWHSSPPHGLPLSSRAPRSSQPTARSSPQRSNAQAI